MSDDTREDDGARIFRAALPGWQSVLSPPKSEGSVLFAPGRGLLEISILLSAFALLFPVLLPPAAAASVFARRAGNRRWLAALIAALWCGFLGLVVRGALGLPAVP
jgi:hypothetical protein